MTTPVTTRLHTAEGYLRAVRGGELRTTYELSPVCGTDIVFAAANACALAAILDAAVTLEFNAVRMQVQPLDQPDRVMSEYHARIDERARLRGDK